MSSDLVGALGLAGRRLARPDMTAAGLAALDWLLEQHLEHNADGEPHLSIIGNDGWLQRGQPPELKATRAKFDQQPLEAYALVDACLAAARVARDKSAVGVKRDDACAAGSRYAAPASRRG